MSEEKENPEQLKKNRKVILGIFGVPAIVILLSTALYYLVESRSIELGTVNNGVLIIPPQQISELSLRGMDDELFDYSTLEPKWAFVIVGDRSCTGSCEQMLYIARQSIVALAKKMSRVRLVYISTDGEISPELQKIFESEYKGILTVSASFSALTILLNKSEIEVNNENSFYVIDPRGWLMMFYQAENTSQDTLNALGKSVVKDMKRLIK